MTPNSVPKLRMLAGPNGSGKSTLFTYLRDNFPFPLGYCLNPDEIERELTLAGRLYLGGWGLRLDDAALAAFAGAHGLATRIRAKLPAVRDNALVVRKGYRAGYFTSIFADLLRREWVSRGESFTFETVMSERGKVELLRHARTRGYRTYLYYICTEAIVINERRIASRVAQGRDLLPFVEPPSMRVSFRFLPHLLRPTDDNGLFISVLRRGEQLHRRRPGSVQPGRVRPVSHPITT